MNAVHHKTMTCPIQSLEVPTCKTAVLIVRLQQASGTILSQAKGLQPCAQILHLKTVSPSHLSLGPCCTAAASVHHLHVAHASLFSPPAAAACKGLTSASKQARLPRYDFIFSTWQECDQQFAEHVLGPFCCSPRPGWCR